jgi:hypothetical protein
VNENGPEVAVALAETVIVSNETPVGIMLPEVAVAPGVDPSAL